MRFLRFSWIICIVSSFTLFSCSKNNDTGPTPVTPKYSTRLLKVYEIDSTKQAPNDTISKRFFFYDNTSRLIIDSFSSSTTYANTIYTNLRTIQYNGGDTFAFRAIRKDYTVSQFLSSDTTYFTFANGYYTNDTVLYDYGTMAPKGSSKTTYIYHPGVVIRSMQNWIPRNAYSAVEKDTIYQNIVNGDIVHQIDSLRSYVNGQFSGSQVNEITVSYLPYPNPFYQLLRATAKNYITGLGIGNSCYSQYAPQHLILQQITPMSEKLTYNYMFRADGYPLSAIITHEINGSKSFSKLLFVYATN